MDCETDKVVDTIILQKGQYEGELETQACRELLDILLYIKRDDIYLYIYIYIYPHHFTDTTASTLTRVSAKTVQDIKLKLF